MIHPDTVTVTHAQLWVLWGQIQQEICTHILYHTLTHNNRCVKQHPNSGSILEIESLK